MGDAEKVVKDQEQKADEAEGESLESEGDDGPESEGGDPRKALQAERGKRKTLAKQVRELNDTVGKLQPLVDEYMTLLPHLPGLLARVNTSPTGNGQTGSAQPDPQLVQIAQDFGFVDAEGRPDLVRAERAVALMDGRVKQAVTAAVKPVAAQSASTASASIRERAYKAVDDKGHPFAKKEHIDAVFGALPPEAAADPNTATLALIIARGLGGPGEAPEEPTFVAGPGRPSGKLSPALTEMDKAVAKLRGKTDDAWKKLTNETPSETGWELE